MRLPGTRRPKLASTQIVLPYTDPGSEPASAPTGTLAWNESTDKPRYKKSDGTWADTGAGGGTGDVVGPGAATDNAVARFDGTTGKLIQNSLVTVSDPGSIALPGGQTVDGRDVSVDGATLDAHVANTSNPHAVTKTQVGLGNVTNDAQLKRADNDWGGFTQDLLPQSDSRLLLEVNNSGAWNKRQVPLSALGGPIDVAADLAPLHWWTASVNSQTGGLVDSLTDQGSSPKNFAQAGAARAPVATDGDGVVYLALDGAADFYVAGVAADWKPWSYVNEPLVSKGFTIAMILNRTVAFTAEEMLLDCCNAQTANIGLALRHLTDGVGAGGAQTGPGFFIANGAGASSLGLVSRGRPYLTKEVLIIRFSNENGGSGGTLDPGGANAPTAMDAIMRRCGSVRSFTRHGPTADSTANPSFALTLGRRASTADRFSASRIYEIILDNKCWSDRQVAGYEERARTVFKVPNL